MNRTFERFWGLSVILVSLALPGAVRAAEIPFSVRQAVVWVHCGNRQGSGVVVNGEKGYVLTNAHVLLDLKTQTPEACEVGFINDMTLEPAIFYEASWDRYVFEESLNRDFAILKIGQPQQHAKLNTFPFLKTDEFSKVGDPISIIAYPSSANGKQDVTNGTINGLEKGIIKTDAVISPGSSGGGGVDQEYSLLGIATRILLIEKSPGVEEVVDYELVDIRAILEWLETFGVNMHDTYFVHANFDRYHKVSTYIQPTNLNCTLLAKSDFATTVYCLKNDDTRTVFPNDRTYHSWFGDFSGVITLPVEQLASFRLTANVTMKPGTLVKIESDPKVYVVADVFGTLRWIETEQKARELYGDGWAGFVKDIPVTFFSSYTIGAPIL